MQGEGWFVLSILFWCLKTSLKSGMAGSSVGSRTTLLPALFAFARAKDAGDTTSSAGCSLSGGGSLSSSAYSSPGISRVRQMTENDNSSVSSEVSVQVP